MKVVASPVSVPMVPLQLVEFFGFLATVYCVAPALGIQCRVMRGGFFWTSALSSTLASWQDWE